MSLIISAYTQEGIVMAADSRVTINVNGNIKYSDSTDKLFLFDGIGISCCGHSNIKTDFINVLIEQYIHESQGKGKSIMQISLDLKNMVNSVQHDKDYNVTFHVFGYENNKRYRCIFRTRDLYEPQVVDITEKDGLQHDGQIDIIDILRNPVAIKDKLGEYTDVVFYKSMIDKFSLQDTVDYVLFLMNTTIKMLHFTDRVDNVAPPVDVLIITPYKAYWLNRKTISI